ncbi:MAG: T9SS type A sorting domain-containing protein [Bacteroidota bacterium]
MNNYNNVSMKSVFMCVCLTVILFLNPHEAQSANRYWIGAGNFNNTANWSDVSGGASGFSVPGISDIAIFDGSNVSNCIVNTNININGFIIYAAYTGTISMNNAVTCIIGTSGFSQSGGTFTGNNGNISVNSTFFMNGGVFNSTSGTLLITSGYTFTSGAFNHNNGIVAFSTTQTITGNTSFYNLTFVASGGIYTITGGTTITSLNNVTISGGAACTINTGTVQIKGDLSLTSSSNNSVNGGSATFLFNGSGTQNINSGISSILVGINERSCCLPNVEIDKISGTLNLNGVINVNGSTWKTTNGASLVNPGTSTVNISSAVTFSGQNLSLYTVHIYANGQVITLSPSYTLTATNNVIINGGSYYQVNTGTLEILGDLTLVNTSTSAVNGGTGTFLFDGSGNQNVNSSASGLNYICALPNILINKTTGTLNFSGIINFNGSSWNTIAGASLVSTSTSTVNVLKTSTLSGQNLSFYDLVVTGNFNTITIGAGVVWTSTHLLTFSGGSSWYQINTGTINAKGDVLVTNTNTSGNVGGNAVLLFDGTANQTLTGSGVAGGGRLPQVTINKTGGTLTLSNIISTDHNWNYISGNVDAITNASTIDFYKTSIIDGQGTTATMSFNHVVFSGFISLGGNLDVNGDFTIRNGTNNRLDVNATNNYQINVAGNWSNNNSATLISFNQQNGKVVFDGGNTQTIALDISTNIETFYNLEINNTGSGVILTAPVTIAGNINFIDGTVASSASNILLLNNLSTSTGASNNSFVSGPVCKTGNQAFVFPVGKNAVYAPIAISAPTVNTNQFTAEYFQANPNPLYSASSKDISLDHISTCEYWMLNRTNGISNVAVNLSWDTRSCGISNLSDLRVAQWNGSQWKDQGTGGTTGTTSSGTVFSGSNVSSFGPFTIGTISTLNSLPIELVYFKGVCDQNNVLLEWGTASENGNDYFSIERSSDAVNWELIQIIKGAGNSNTLNNYSFSDPIVSTQISYYRLKETDYDLTYKYFDMIDVAPCKTKPESDALIIYPNPSEGIIYLSFEGDVNSLQSIEVVNMLGNIVYYSTNFTDRLDLSEYTAGVYFVCLKSNEKSIIEKVIITKGV